MLSKKACQMIVNEDPAAAMSLALSHLGFQALVLGGAFALAVVAIPPSSTKKEGPSQPATTASAPAPAFLPQ